MTDDQLRQAAELHYLMSEEELYTLLVPPEARTQVYSRGGMIAKGKAVFVETVSKYREAICNHYRNHVPNSGNAIDLVVVLATGLEIHHAMTGIPVIALSALLVKIGLEGFCKERKNDTAK